MAALMLTPYIIIFGKQKMLSSTSNRELFIKKFQDTDIYTPKVIGDFLLTDKNLTRTQIMLAMNDTLFLLFAAYKGCCDVDWEGLLKMKPCDYVEYVNAGYERVAKKFPNVLTQFNRMREQNDNSPEL